jgi:hypothetical protein
LKGAGLSDDEARSFRLLSESDNPDLAAGEQDEGVRTALSKRGLLERKGGKWRVSERGRRLMRAMRAGDWDVLGRVVKGEDASGDDGEEFGGPGSGHHGHKGIPGQRGGSTARGAAVSGGSYISFDSQDKATKWLMSEESINPGLSEDENESDAHVDINNDLREAGYSEDARADLIEGAIEKASLPNSVIAYRGADWDTFAEYDYDLTGSIIEDGAFVSTSLIKNVAKSHADGVLIEIKVPQGAKAINAERWGVGGWSKGEAELLLQKDARFKILSDSYSDDIDERHLVAELLK